MYEFIYYKLTLFKRIKWKALIKFKFTRSGYQLTKQAYKITGRFTNDGIDERGTRDEEGADGM